MTTLVIDVNSKKNVKINKSKKSEKVTPKTFLKRCVFTDIPQAKNEEKK